MIIKFNEDKTKIIKAESNSLFPNEDWYDDGHYVVNEMTDEGKLLASKITQYYPYFDVVLNGNGEIIDVTPTERPPVEPLPPQPPSPEERLSAIEDLLITLI